jgi:hypothetical protein
MDRIERCFLVAAAASFVMFVTVVAWLELIPA